jgi:hypothetical protein
MSSRTNNPRPLLISGLPSAYADGINLSRMNSTLSVSLSAFARVGAIGRG